MKKVLLLITFLFSIVCFSQAITINTTTYTSDELVKTVLTNNSPCINIRNVQSSTGTSAIPSSTNGIGYFTNTNPNFPLQNGVVLTTGNVLNSPGPNTTTLSDGTLAWNGDTDLENALAAAGITMVSKNVTVLEFDFTPISPNFNFQFLFASEEYGTYQCFSPDAFAFLLTDSFGVTQNLAVIPNTTIPISVQTIRNETYNPSCTSANPSFFGLFNDGSAAAAAATNYNGQTVLMNASSTNLQVNTTYHIKLVIADGNNDNQFDSAVFLGGGSFNFGQDVLGPDLTINTNSALCSNNGINEPYTITSGLDSNLFDFVWKDANGIPIPGATNSSLTINQPGTYLLTYYVQSSNCEVATNNITIEYSPVVFTNEPLDLFLCNSGQSSYVFDFNRNLSLVQLNGLQITFHESQNDAENEQFSLPLTYNVNAVDLPKTIWIRVEDNSTGCYITKSFILNTTSGPTVTNPGTMESCETTSGTGTAAFILSSNTNTILGTQSSNIFEVLYYATQAEAISGSSTNIIGSYNSGNATIYVRVQLISDPSCFNASMSFNLVVNPKPVVIDLLDQYVCVNYTLPSLTLGNYYSGMNGTGLQLNPNDIISTDQTIYVYYKNPITGCESETNFIVTIVEIQDLTPANTISCDTYAIPSYPYPGTRYFRQDGGPVAGNIELFPGNPINTLGLNTIYVYFQSPTDLTCIIFSSYTVTISKTPIITGTFPNLFDCLSITTLQPITTDIGIANYYTLDNTGVYTPVVLPIISDTILYVFAENNTCRTPILSFTAVIGTSSFLDTFDSCEPYNLLPPTVGEYRTEPNGLGTIIQPGLITQTTTVYQYIPGATCTDSYSFTIRILKPSLTDPVPVTECERFPLPVNTEGASYYTSSGGPNNPSNVQLLGGVDSITTTTTVYVFKPSTTSISCYNEKTWNITINQRPILDAVATRYIDCYSFTLAPLSVGNYYHRSGGVDPITLPYTIDNTNTTNNIKTVYIYAANPNDANCISETSFIVDLDGVAIPNTFKGNKTACESYTLPVLPSNVFYYTEPHNPDGTGGGNIIPALTQYTSSTTTPIYIYTQTNVRRICADESSFTITIVKRPIANPSPAELQECDTFGLNNGIFEFDLTDSTIKTDILNGQTPEVDFTLSFFTTQFAANDSTALPIILPNKYQNTTPFTDSVWVRLTNNTITNPCFDVVELKLKVNLLPNVQLAPEYFICSDYEKNTIVNPATLNTGLTTANYDFAWTLNGNATGGNTATLTVVDIGTYEVIVTDKTPLQCEKTMSTEVKLYAPYITIEYSDAFENPTFITINVLGAGSENYEYQLNDSNFQDSPVFYNVTSGEYIVNVRDKNGLCSPAPSEVFIINYPKFFTPNGDGFHEKWNLESLKATNPNVPISIFDRFGKFIKQITPSTDGWDGKFNGQPLPATDYWFTVDFTEKGSSKTFKSHFSLKR